jgi:uncharacterized secreted protein with C-terminal beta-propeller domain
LKLQAQGFVPGHIRNSWQVKEFAQDQTLVIASTSGWGEEMASHVTVLGDRSDGHLEVESSIANLSKGEDVRAARFVGTQA